MSKILIIGGPGNISASTIQYLLAEGHQLALYSLPASLETIRGDARIFLYPGSRDDTQVLASAIQTFSPDIVIDFVCFHPNQAEALLPLIRGKVSQFIFVSTVDVYGYPLANLPMRESDPWRPTVGAYAANKRACEAIFQRPGQAELPLTIARPSYSFGPPFLLSFNWHAGGPAMITRLRQHRPILVPGDGTTLLHVCSAFNTGRMIAHLAGEPKALGRDYTVAHPTILTHDGYVGLFANVLGVEPVLVHIPSDVILAQDDPAARDSMLRVVTGFNVAFSIDRFKSDFPDFTWTMSLVQWARHYIDFHDAAGDFPAPDEVIFDDRLIAAYQKAVAQLSI